MPTIDQQDISDPIELRLRQLGEHLDAERVAHAGHPDAAESEPRSDAAGRLVGTDLLVGASGGDRGGLDPQPWVRYRWLGAAAALVAIVAAGAAIAGNRGSAAVQTAPSSVSSTATPADSAASTEPTSPAPTTLTATTVPTTTLTATTVPTTAPTEASGPSTVPGETVAAAGRPAGASDAAWALWPDAVNIEDAGLMGARGETISIASGPAGAIFASATTVGDKEVVEIWITNDGVAPEPVTFDGLVGLSGATVGGTSDAYYVAAESDGKTGLWRSADGQDWSQLDDSFTGALLGAAGPGPALFRRMPDGTIESSRDGLAWAPLETSATTSGEPTTYSVTAARFVGGEHGYLGAVEVDDRLAFAESVDGQRWVLLPAAPVFGIPAAVDGGVLVVGADWETCDDPCRQSAYRFNDQTVEWSPVATPPLGGFIELERVGDTVVASGVVERDGRAVVEVFVSPVDEIEWTRVEISGAQAPIPGDASDAGLADIVSFGNRVVIPVPGPFGQFIVGAVADGTVANYGLESLPMCEPTGPVAQECVYEVVPGDHPTSIAAKFGVDIEALFTANADVPVPPFNAMLVGTRVIIPPPNG